MTNDDRNEPQTPALDLIDPALKAAGLGRGRAGSHVCGVEVIALGRLQGAGTRAKQEVADYVLVYKNHRSSPSSKPSARVLPVTEGLGQAKKYAEKLQTPFAYFTNGHDIYRVDMHTGEEGEVAGYPTPDELWQSAYGESEARERNLAGSFLSRALSRTRAGSGSRATTSTTPLPKHWMQSARDRIAFC